jgi:hypothetical protein
LEQTSWCTSCRRLNSERKAYSTTFSQRSCCQGGLSAPAAWLYFLRAIQISWEHVCKAFKMCLHCLYPGYAVTLHPCNWLINSYWFVTCSFLWAQKARQLSKTQASLGPSDMLTSKPFFP